MGNLYKVVFRVTIWWCTLLCSLCCVRVLCRTWKQLSADWCCWNVE